MQKIDLNNKTVLVTGAPGFIGTNMASHRRRASGKGCGSSQRGIGIFTGQNE